MKDERQSTHEELPQVTPESVFGGHLRASRQDKGWSQQDLAERMSSRGFRWRQTTVAKTEAGDRPIRLNEAVALSELLGARLGDLVQPEKPPLASRLDAERTVREELAYEAQRLTVQARKRQSEIKFSDARIRALESLLRFSAEGGEEALASAVAGALYWFPGDEQPGALLAEAGVPGHVLESARKYADERLGRVEREQDENAFDVWARLYMTHVLNRFNGGSWGEADVEHREAP